MTTGQATSPRGGVRAAVLGALLVLAGLNPAAAAAAPAPGPESACAAGTGPYQRELEEHVGRPVDGVQSSADCFAVRAFQRKNGVTPADGYPGVATYRTMLVVAARPNPNAEGDCPVRSYRVTCVDMGRRAALGAAGQPDRLPGRAHPHGPRHPGDPARLARGVLAQQGPQVHAVRRLPDAVLPVLRRGPCAARPDRLPLRPRGIHAAASTSPWPTPNASGTC